MMIINVEDYDLISNHGLLGRSIPTKKKVMMTKTIKSMVIMNDFVKDEWIFAVSANRAIFSSLVVARMNSQGLSDRDVPSR
jgi:hypothetical protein